MKVLIGCSSPLDKGAGGILEYTKELSECLITLGVEVHIASPEPKDWSWCRRYRIRHIRTCQYADPVSESKRLYEYIKSSGIDGIINNDNPYLQSILALVKCPSIAVGHLGEGVIASLACYQHEWTDYVVAISYDMFTTFVTKFDLPVMKCPIVFNGVRDRVGEKGVDSIELGNIRVVFAGGYNRRKGAKKILSSILGYSERWKGATLDWFGYVPDRIIRKTSHLGFVNYRDKVDREEFIKALESSDIIMLPSETEGCPMAMIEAMCMSVMPIASNGIGAMKSMVTNGQDGFICQLEDWSNRATDCLRFLVSNPGILMKLKANARKRYLQEFQAEIFTNKLMRLLSQPTVERDVPRSEVEILHWHRPVPRGKDEATFINKIRIRSGVLRRAGCLRV